MRTESIRNIILYVNDLKKKLNCYEIYNQDIEITIDLIMENINYLIQDNLSEYKYCIENLKKQNELIEFLKKQNEN